MIVLDTHTAIWWSQQPELLGSAAKASIETADSILIPVIAFWETAILVRKGRLALKRGQPVAEWANSLLSIPRVRAVPLTARMAIEADNLVMHADPANRFIAITAMRYSVPLITKDSLLHGIPWLNTIW